MSQVRLELSSTIKMTPAIQKWLTECEELISEKTKDLEHELLIHGACCLVVEGAAVTATEINLRKMTL
jgi:hypothetical protein